MKDETEGCAFLSSSRLSPSALLLLLCLAGCDRPAARPAASRPTVPAGTGVIAGRVVLLGNVPALPPIIVPAGDCHRDRAWPDESILADADEGDRHGLRNVVVYLKDSPNVDLPAAPVVVDQVGCQFRPHVVAVRTGQVVRFRSSDATLHNVHGACNVNAPFNFGLTSAGATRDVTFDRPEVFRVTCDVHPWMNAWVAVLDHPLFAVTGDAGRFEIRGVPPGTYTLVAWHERFGERSQTVTVSGLAAPGAQPPTEIYFGAGK